MSGEGLSVPTPSSTSASNLTVPSGSSAKGNQGIVRRLSQIASNFAHSSVESQLTDDAIKELGGKLMRDYVRDRLFRNGILSDDHGFIEDNNNLINGISVGNESTFLSNADFHQSDNFVDGSHFLGVSSVSACPVSRSNSFTGGQRQSSPSGRIGACPLSPVSPSATDGTHPLADSPQATRRSRTSLSSPSAPTAQPVDAIAVALRRYCLYLEKAHTATYREVSRPLCITMASLDIIRDAINHISDSVLTDVKEFDAAANPRSPNAMWAKIASLYVLTSTFCLDCTVQGHAGHISDVITMSLDRIFCDEVCSRIRSVGGWSNLVDVSKDSKKDKDLLPVILVVAVGAVLGLIPAWLFH